MKYLIHFWTLKPVLVTTLAFLLPLKLVVDYAPLFELQSKCAYVIIVMAILWLTEAIPIPVTSLMPIFLFPLLGVESAKDVSGSYVTDTTMLFLGGLIIAVALEETGLHNRISLCVMMVVGAQPIFIMAGLMATTWFLSMWISNTAATSMMIPIISAVIKTVSEVRRASRGTDHVNAAYEATEDQLENVPVTVIQNGNLADKMSVGNDTESPRENVQTGDAGYKRSVCNDTEDQFENYTEGQLGNGTVMQNGDSGDKSAVCNDTEDQLEYGKVMKNGKSGGKSYSLDVKSDSESEPSEDDINSSNYVSPEMKRYAKAFAISVAYGANIGGIATLTGTPPNLVLKQNADQLYASYKHNGTESLVPFAKWMGFAFPLSLITAVIGWAWLCLLFVRCGCCKRMNKAEKDAINKTIRMQFKQLGFLSMAEIQVLVIFVLLVFLWLFQSPPNVKGWGDVSSFKKGYLSDSTPCILLSVVLFLLPKSVPKVFCLAKEGRPSYEPILTWAAVVNKLPWGVILLLGGGFAIANASKSAGLSKWVGDALATFAYLDNWVLNLIVSAIVAAVTEVTSNTATATLLMPILAQMGISTKTHPMYLMISATVACSFAFMLPVATPPNAIVFSTGYLTIPDMALAGLLMNIIAVLCLTLAINTWGINMWGMDVFPEIFAVSSATLTTSSPRLFNTTNSTLVG